MFEVCQPVETVTEPDDLASRTESLTAIIIPLSRSKSGSLNLVEVVRDPDTDLAIGVGKQ